MSGRHEHAGGYMYVVISGAGKVGFELASILSISGADVAVIEKKLDVCEELARTLERLLVIHGDGADVRYQEEAGISRADVFAAVTGDDDDNIVACQLARVSFDVPRTVARINNPKNEPIFHALEIEGISSTTIIAQLIQEEATIGDLLTLRTIRHGDFAVVEIQLREDAVACGKQVSELALPEKTQLLTVVRETDIIVPDGETVLQSGDMVIALAALSLESELEEALTGKAG